MGRKTFESIGGPLSGRDNIVLTRQQPIPIIPDQAIIIGGEQIYRLFMPQVTRMYLTIVHRVCVGDTYFPYSGQWQTVEAIHHEGYTFLTLDRVAEK